MTENVINSAAAQVLQCVNGLLRVPHGASIAPVGSGLAEKIKKKIQHVRKISCEFYLTEFISLMFGRFTSNTVFDFLV